MRYFPHLFPDVAVRKVLIIGDIRFDVVEVSWRLLHFYRWQPKCRLFLTFYEIVSWHVNMVL